MARSDTKVLRITEVIDGIIDLIKKNLIAKTNVTSKIIPGTTTIHVENTFQYSPDEEIVFIDYGFNNSSHTHYNRLEYARIKEINNTTSMTLHNSALDTWTLSDQTFIQKTIAHSPLFTGNVLYGDRAVIPTNDIAITVHPEDLSNEWLYIQGGLSQQYRAKIIIYDKTIDTEEGGRITDMYADAIYKLLNENIHLDIGSYDTLLTSNASSGTNTIQIQDTSDNQEKIVLSSTLNEPYAYAVQDNQGWDGHFKIENISISGGNMTIEFDRNLGINLSTSDFARLIKLNRYIYNSRVDSINYGFIKKGSAIVRAAELSWFGEEINEHRFPQRSKGIG